MFQELKLVFQIHARVDRYETSDKYFAYKMEENSSSSEHVLRISGYYNRLNQGGVNLPDKIVIDRILYINTIASCQCCSIDFTRFSIGKRSNRSAKEIIVVGIGDVTQFSIILSHHDEQAIQHTSKQKANGQKEANREREGG